MMTRHPGVGQLRAHIAGEIPAAESERIRAHIAQCSQCTAELQWIDDVVETIPSLPTHRAPEEVWNRIANAPGRGATLLPSFTLHKDSAVTAHTPARAFLRAAVLLLIAAGAASAALPNSPVRAWLRRVFAGSSTSTMKPAPAAPVDTVAVAAEPGSDAVFVLPTASGAPVTIAVEAPDPRLRIRLVLVDGSEVEVRATSDAAKAQFHSGPGRLGIVGGGSGEVVLSVPRSAARVDMQVDGRLYLEKRGTRINILAPTADTVGAEIIFPVK